MQSGVWCQRTDYLSSQLFNRLRLGVFFELLVLHLVKVSFPGFRLFCLLPFVPIVSVLQGVRIRFFIFPMVGSLLQCEVLKTGPSAFRAQVARAATCFIVILQCYGVKLAGWGLR